MGFQRHPGNWQETLRSQAQMHPPSAPSAPGGKLTQPLLSAESAPSEIAALDTSGKAGKRKAPSASGGKFKHLRAAALSVASDNEQWQLGGRGQASDGQRLEKTKWYKIEFADRPKSRCRCKGNCLTGCPARHQGASCPNPATWNLPKLGRKRYNAKVPLCDACVCQTPQCNSGARRPYGKHAQNLANAGRCRRCWTL